MSETNGRKASFTPWAELKRYGLKKAFCSSWTFWSACGAITLTLLMPWGPRAAIDTLTTLHVTMLGFGLVIFGFTILGGKDDFFEPVMHSQGVQGLEALRKMVLYLFWPLLLHGIAVALCLARLSDGLFVWTCSKMLWRLCYGFISIWAAIQTYLSVRYLFRLAVMRLVWRYTELRKSKRMRGCTTGAPTMRVVWRHKGAKKRSVGN